MRLSVILRTLGVLFLLFSTTLLPPIAISFFYGDGEAGRFSIAFAIALFAGLAFWLPYHKRAVHIRSRDGFLIVTLMWTAMSLLGAVPFMLALDASFADAFFESASGYTTTGATVFVGLDEMSPSILFYRQEIQWLGGIGVIVLAIALLPMLGIGGMQLYKAETPGPFKDERLTPRITRTARNVCGLYVLLTAICAVLYWLSGMNGFDAISHSFSTLATGGFSPHDDSIAFFDSPAIEGIAIVFMLIGGISFNAHFIAWRTLQLQRYGQDTQTVAFLSTVAVATIAATLVLAVTGTYDTAAAGPALCGLRGRHRDHDHGLHARRFFALAARAARADDLPELPRRLRGLDVGRHQGDPVRRARQAGRGAYPQADPPAGRAADQGRRAGRAGLGRRERRRFLRALRGGVRRFMMLAMMDGMDQVTAFGAVATCINNTGPGLGTVAITFSEVSPQSKIVFAFAMLIGRLEIFTFLVLLAPAFWRR